MGSILDICDLRGPPGTTLRTPWGSMDPRLRTYALTEKRERVRENRVGKTREGYMHRMEI